MWTELVTTAVGGFEDRIIRSVADEPYSAVVGPSHSDA